MRQVAHDKYQCRVKYGDGMKLFESAENANFNLAREEASFLVSIPHALLYSVLFVFFFVPLFIYLFVSLLLCFLFCISIFFGLV